MSANNQEIVQKVISLVSRQFDKVFTEQDFDKKFNDLSTDYIDKIEIVMRLEDEFSVQITDEEVDQIIFIKDFVHTVAMKK